ncbi:MAG: heavy metal translocating P-type ATPase metal-binding domain-containing protein [Chryseolinea sp.]
MVKSTLIKSLPCFHCGEPCESTSVFDGKSFCCQGCKTVYEILNENDLCEYYEIDGFSRMRFKEVAPEAYDYLDNADVSAKILQFESEHLSKVSFYIPAIHCASCIWLLESLDKFDDAIIKTEVSFGRKSVTIDYDPSKVKLSALAALLAKVGYAPIISLQENDILSDKSKNDRQLVYKLAVAGFCFGNIMLFSFPEYLGLDGHDSLLRSTFSFLNLLLAVPVVAYSASGYFNSALKSLRVKEVNIDIPIALGLLALFVRSTYEIIMSVGPGYFDSFSGLVFFLLIGRWFQSKTYESLAFDRDFKSYFPLAVNVYVDNTWKPTVIYQLRSGDVIRLRNMEIVPADSTLQEDEAFIDYSFVTGESRPVACHKDDLVYAGGRVIGKPVVLHVLRQTYQSHLTSLWNKAAFGKVHESHYKKLIDRAARKFTIVVIALAIVTGVVWQFHDPSRMWLVITSVLMVACPCALALAAPFTYGSILREFGKRGFYLKNSDVVERIANIDTVVFDKTGTITNGNEPSSNFIGALTAEDEACIKVMTGASLHPLSKIIERSIGRYVEVEMNSFMEIPGRGLIAEFNGRQYKVGSAAFVDAPHTAHLEQSRVFVSVDDDILGFYALNARVRPGVSQMIKALGQKCRALVSGDGDGDRDAMMNLFGSSVEMLFTQTPEDKMNYVETLQNEGKKVMMVGDGLNDSGALKQSDVGVAVCDDTGIFTPACDGIITGNQIGFLHDFMALAKSSNFILRSAFAISFSYNAVALSFAMAGHLTPLVAAILMPLSSVSVVVFSSFAVNLAARTHFSRIEFITK